MPLDGKSNGITLSEKGVPDLFAIGASLFSPFEVKRLGDARTLWLNDRWFAQQGIDISQPEIYAEISDEVLDTYGVTTEHAVPPSAMSGVARTMFADRYGGTGGAGHGGSGRCGTLGGYNAKGVGRTPLTPDYADWGHSHGCVSMTEAIRETINAEVAQAELPYGAVPVVAIIDTGLEFHPDQQNLAERRVIIIRPNFIRPAHFERSIFFGSSGTAESDQYLDACRVRETIQSVCEPSDPAISRFSGLKDMTLRIAEQIGAARAHRLWQGLFVTSNISIDGALVDFGAFRALPDWRRCSGSNKECFGDEIRPLTDAVSSLMFYFRKYAPAGYTIPPLKPLIAEAGEAIDRSFRKVALKGMGVHEDTSPKFSEPLKRLLDEYWSLQQTQRTTIEDVRNLPWLYDLFQHTPVSAVSGDVAVAREIYSLCESSFGVKSGVSRTNIERWLRPRTTMYFSNADSHARRGATWLTGDLKTDRLRIAAYIGKRTSSSRRFWPNAPKNLHIYTQHSDLKSTVLSGLKSGSGAPAVWLEGPVFDGYLHVLGIKIQVSALGASHVMKGNFLQVLVDQDATTLRDNRITVGNTTIDLDAAANLEQPR